MSEFEYITCVHLEHVYPLVVIQYYQSHRDRHRQSCSRTTDRHEGKEDVGQEGGVCQRLAEVQGEDVGGARSGAGLDVGVFEQDLDNGQMYKYV